MERFVYGGVKPEPAASGLFSAQTSEVWLVPALDLYDGVNYRALYKAKQGGYWPVTLQVLILSAKHALLVPQPLIDYDDQRMTREQAVSLQQKAGAELDAILTQQHLMKYQVQSFDLYTYAIKYSRIVDNRPFLYYAVSMKLSAYAKQQGISYQTAWRMWQRGELPAHQLPSGTVIVDVPPTLQAIRPRRVAVYARVSSTENRKNLESQAERVATFCAAKGWQVAKVVKECGSGVNDQRPQFLALLADTSISHIIVEHKDRCSRFGVAYIQTLLKAQGRELVIVNEADNGQEDLMQDFVAIITSFTARLYGRRRASRKKTQVLAALEMN